MKIKTDIARNRKVAVFSSLDDENQAEYSRLAQMTPTQRLNEFSALQKRVFGGKWTKNAIPRIASIEKVTW
jgi:hypothetical protein